MSAPKYLDSTGLNYLWNKIKAFINSKIKLPANYSTPSSGGALAGNDSFASALGKLERNQIDNELVTSGALNDLEESKYEMPDDGIPKTHLANAVQTSLGKADNAIQTVKVNNTALTPDSNKAVNISATPKVSSSTDNAVARFDGTGGSIQNSGVTINDSNHVTAPKFITSGGTSSQFVKGDGSLDSKSYMKLKKLVTSGYVTTSSKYVKLEMPSPTNAWMMTLGVVVYAGYESQIYYIGGYNYQSGTQTWHSPSVIYLSSGSSTKTIYFGKNDYTGGDGKLWVAIPVGSYCHIWLMENSSNSTSFDVSSITYSLLDNNPENWDASTNGSIAFTRTVNGTGGFLTAETDPVFAASPAASITTGDIANWNSSVGVSITSTTYSALKALRDGGNLLAGAWYRITDFVTTTSQEDTQSAGHQFDIIVRADSASTLNENAYVAVHSGDTYFANSKLEAWELKYCLDNDTARFAWANSTNGKGVIYYMKDEWNNECPYDFKNIKFKRTGNSNNDIYCYTFSFYYDDSDSSIVDASIKGNDGTLLNDENTIEGVHENVIKEYHELTYDDPPACPIKLNNIVFLSTESNDGGLYYGCYSNTFGNDCFNNTFGDSCYCNTIGDYCYSNTFGGGVCYNIIKNVFHGNTVGDLFTYNSFGINCSSNVLGANCSCNNFGDACENIILGNRCSYNTFGNGCEYIVFGTSSTTKDYYNYIIVDGGNKYIYLNNTQTLSSSNRCRNIHICQGVNNSTTYKQIDISVAHNAYQIEIKNENSKTITVS